MKPLDNRFLQQIATNNNEINNISLTKQPTANDWIQLNVAGMRAVPELTDTDYPFRITMPSEYVDLMAIGDRVQLTQTGTATTQYFYVVAKNADIGYLIIEGRDDFALTDQAITMFKYSKSVNPLDFPDRISLDLDLDPFDYEFADCAYSITGALCTVQFYIHSEAGSSDSELEFRLPVPAGLDSSASGFYNQVYDYAITTDGHAPLKAEFLARVRIDGSERNKWYIQNPTGKTMFSFNNIGSVFVYPITFTPDILI